MMYATTTTTAESQNGTRHAQPSSTSCGSAANGMKTAVASSPPEAEPLERRQLQPADGLRDVTQRVAAGVTVRRRVGRLAGADAVEHEDDRAPRHAVGSDVW